MLNSAIEKIVRNVYQWIDLGLSTRCAVCFISFNVLTVMVLYPLLHKLFFSTISSDKLQSQVAMPLVKSNWTSFCTFKEVKICQCIATPQKMYVSRNFL